MSENNENEMRKALEKAAIEWDKESTDDQFASEVFDDGFKRAWAHQQVKIDSLQQEIERLRQFVIGAPVVNTIVPPDKFIERKMQEQIKAKVPSIFSKPCSVCCSRDCNGGCISDGND